MPTYEWRRLWTSVSISDRLERVSTEAALLWTWCIPHMDDYGMIQGEVGHIKAIVVPRMDWTKDQIKGYLDELFRENLLIMHNNVIEMQENAIECKRMIIEMVAFQKHQPPGNGKHRRKSELYEIVYKVDTGYKKSGKKQEGIMQDNVRRCNGNATECKNPLEEKRKEKKRLENENIKGSSVAGFGMTTPAAPASEDSPPLSAKDASLQFKKIVADLKAKQNQKEG